MNDKTLLVLAGGAGVAYFLLRPKTADKPFFPVGDTGLTLANLKKLLEGVATGVPDINITIPDISLPEGSGGGGSGSGVVELINKVLDKLTGGGGGGGGGGDDGESLIDKVKEVTNEAKKVFDRVAGESESDPDKKDLLGGASVWDILTGKKPLTIDIPGPSGIEVNVPPPPSVKVNLPPAVQKPIDITRAGVGYYLHNFAPFRDRTAGYKPIHLFDPEFQAFKADNPDLLSQYSRSMGDLSPSMRAIMERSEAEITWSPGDPGPGFNEPAVPETGIDLLLWNPPAGRVDFLDLVPAWDPASGQF